MYESTPKRRVATFRILAAFMLLMAALLFTGVSAWADGEDSSSLDGDTAGTLFTLDEKLANGFLSGDLYWAGTTLTGKNLQVGNDMLFAAGSATLSNVSPGDDIRAVTNHLKMKDVTAIGNMTLVAFSDLTIDAGTSAKGIYCGGDTIEFDGTASYFEAYGTAIYFNGKVDGDVSLSAQDIVIGPDAEVTGTLLVRSGQELDIPTTAQIATVDNTLDNPNTIDQLTELRSVIAPYFQVGGFLFMLVAGILIGLILLWINGRQLYEAQRILRTYPLGHLLMGFLGLLVLVVATVACFALILTIPVGIVLLLLLVVSVILCVPFTGVSLMLMAVGRMRPALCVIVGSGAATLLLFVPYVRYLVVLFSLIYMLGYVLRCHFLGHDRIFEAEMEEDRRRRDAKTEAERAAKKAAKDSASQPAAGSEDVLSAEAGKPVSDESSAREEDSGAGFFDAEANAAIDSEAAVSERASAAEGEATEKGEPDRNV